MQSRAEKFRLARDSMPVHAESPRGYVTVTRNERGEVSVKLRPGTMRRLSERELAQEVQGGLAAALAEYARGAARLRDEILIMDNRGAPAPNTFDPRGTHRG